MSYHSTVHYRPRLFESVVAIIVASLSIAGVNLKAEVIFDGTLGTSGSLAGPDFQINADRGSQVGSNLFHSFSQFNLANTESASFNGPAVITNVISRVTGGNLSSINGQLNVTIPQANFYFVNPAGVVVGPDATLNIDGTFNTSTADYLVLPDSGRFDVTAPNQTVLTVGDPVSYGFLDNQVGSIAVESAQLVTGGNGIALVGGAIRMDGTKITTQGGDAYIVAVDAPGDIAARPVPWEEIGANSSGDIHFINNAEMDTSGTTSGAVVIRGGRLIVEGSLINASTNGEASGGDIDIEVSALDMDNGAKIITSTSSSGRGGDITVKAESVIRLNDESRISSSTIGDGDGGDIYVQSTAIELLEGSRIESTAGTLGVGLEAFSGFRGSIFVSPYVPTKGNGGSVKVVGKSIVLSDELFREPTSFEWYLEKNSQNELIALASLFFDKPNEFSKLNASIQDQFTLDYVEWAARWDTDTASTIQRIRSENISTPSGIYTTSVREGDSGSINIKADTLEILGRAQINSRTDKISPDIDENNSFFFNIREGSSGGNIDIETNTLTVRSHGLDSIGVGNVVWFVVLPQLNNGGNGITASLLPQWNNISRTRVFYNAGIYSDARITTGDSGDIRIRAKEIAIENGGQIITSVEQAGQAGDIELSADVIRLDGTDLPTSEQYIKVSEINSSTLGESLDAGSIILTAKEIDVTNGFVLSASTDGQGNAGEITLSGENITIDNGSVLESKTTGSGNAGNIVVLGDDISLLNGATISSSSTGLGDGGSISITSDKQILITGKSLISSNTTNDGDAGSIDLEAPLIEVLGGSRVTTTTGTAAELALDTNPVINLPAFPDPYIPTSGEGGDITLVADRVVISNEVYWEPHAFTEYLEERGYTEFLETFLQATNDPDYFIQMTPDDQAAFNSALTNLSDAWYLANRGIISKIRSENARDPGGLFSESLSEGDAGNISITANTIDILGKAQISSRTTKTSPDYDDDMNEITTLKDGSDGGDINLNAKRVTIESHDLPGLLVTDRIFGPPITRLESIWYQAGIYSSAEITTGTAGNITIETDVFSLTKGAIIDSSVSQGGDRGGDIRIVSESITIDGTDDPDNSGVKLSKLSAGTVGTSGDAGLITLIGEDIELLDGAQVVTNSYGTGNAGNISLSGSDIRVLSGAVVATNAEDYGPSGGSAGAITFDSSGLIEVSGQFPGDQSPALVKYASSPDRFSSSVLATTDGFGTGGTISLDGRTLRLSDNAVLSSKTSGTGSAGAISMSGSDIELSGGASATTATQGMGAGGTINLDATGVVTLAGTDTGLSADSLDAGDGGAISLSGRRVVVRDGASVSTTSFDEAAGGTVMIDARKVLLSAAIIESQSAGSNAGGAIRIEGDDLIMDKSTIIRASNTGNGDAGSIELVTSDTIRIRDSEISTEAVAGGGGEITLLTRKLLKLDQVTLSTSVLGGDGSAGNIFIDPELVVLKNSVIRANAVQGDGGNIRIQAGLVLQDAYTLIDASSEYGIDGSVVIDAPVLQIQNRTKSTKKVAKPLVRNRCKARNAGGSSFTVTASAPSMPGPQASLVATSSDIFSEEQGVTNRDYTQLAALRCSK